MPGRMQLLVAQEKESRADTAGGGRGALHLPKWTRHMELQRRIRRVRQDASAKQSSSISIGEKTTRATCNRAQFTGHKIHTMRTALKWLVQTQKGMLGARPVVIVRVRISADAARTVSQSA